MESLLRRIRAGVAWRWARWQYHPLVLRLGRGRSAADPVPSKVGERGDLRHPRFVSAYTDILAFQREERRRVRVDPRCCRPDVARVAAAYARRRSHGGTPGRSRALELKMVWETVWPVMHLSLEPGLHVADVGCENSCLPLYFAYLGCEAYGIDAFIGGYGEFARQELLDRCEGHRLVLSVEEKVAGSLGTATYVCEEATAVALPDASFDRVSCISTLEHIPDDSAAARELGRVLKPGGLLALTVPFGATFSQGSEQPHHKTPDGQWRGDLDRVYSREALLERIVGPSGLEVVGGADVHLEFPPAGRRLPGPPEPSEPVCLVLRKR